MRLLSTGAPPMVTLQSMPANSARLITSSIAALTAGRSPLVWRMSFKACLTLAIAVLIDVPRVWREAGLGSTRDEYLSIRARRAEITHDALRQAGVSGRVDHRSTSAKVSIERPCCSTENRLQSAAAIHSLAAKLISGGRRVRGRLCAAATMSHRCDIAEDLIVVCVASTEPLMHIRWKWIWRRFKDWNREPADAYRHSLRLQRVSLD
jgi:hypothetical protein